jgi:exonuclease III
MMDVLNINANKRLAKFYDDVSGTADVLLVQEWANHASSSVLNTVDELPGKPHRSVTKYLLAESKHEFTVLYEEDRVQVLDFSGVRIVNVYLPAGASRERADMMNRLRNDVLPPFHPISLMVGDFNLAPTPEDGWYGPEISTWTKGYERQEFLDLQVSCGLQDLGLSEPWSATFERMNSGKLTAFRCDLALADESMWKWVDYIHDLRKSGKTDHSGILVRRKTP